MKKYAKLLRLKHWIKNILIFIPMISSKQVNYDSVFKCILAFFAFSFACSFIYIINDIKDIEKDKLHPRKKKRPLPSGEITIKNAIIVAIIMIVSALLINILLSNKLFSYSLCFLLTYIIINIFYSCGFKNVAILDIALLASGFVLRVYYGASVINVEVSSWLFLTILTGALFLGIGKRKKEFLNHSDTRGVLSEYNENFLNQFLYSTLVLMIVFYSLWTIEQATKYLVFTVPLVIIIFMKYCLIMEKGEEGDPITILYQDKLLISLCAIYGILMILLLLVV